MREREAKDYSRILAWMSKRWFCHQQMQNVGNGVGLEGDDMSGLSLVTLSPDVDVHVEVETPRT